MDIFFPIIQMSLKFESIILVGFITGILSGTFGIGGSIMIISFMLHLGISYSTIFVTAIMQTITFSIGSFMLNFQKNNIDHKLLVPILKGSLISNVFYFTAYPVLRKLPNMDTIIILIYISALICIFFLTLYGIISKNKLELQKYSTNIVHKKKLFFSGMTVGFVSSFTGLGGGFIIMPILANIINIPKKHLAGAISTYTLINAILIICYKIIFYKNKIDILFMITMSAGSLMGIGIGNAINRKSDKKILNIIYLALISLIIYFTSRDFLLMPKEKLTIYQQ